MLQGYVLDSIRYLLYTNNLPASKDTFADYINVVDQDQKSSIQKLQISSNVVIDRQCKIKLNGLKSISVNLPTRRLIERLPLNVNETVVPFSINAKYLETILDFKLIKKLDPRSISKLSTKY